MADSGLATDTFNVVCGARLRAVDGPAAARRIIEHFRFVARPFSWWVAPGDEPQDLAARLTSAGLERQETERAMVLELPTLLSRLPGTDGIDIREPATPEELEAFARINAENRDPPDLKVETFYRDAAGTILAAESPQKVFVALDDGQPVAGVELTLAAGLGGIYNPSTRVAHRRRGIGGASLATACRRAAELGAGTVVLQASAAGAGLYRAFGFREFGQIDELKPPHS